ncbi:MAG TPA: glycosyltransferase family 9 protein [Acidimicrobiales bacterium]|nr:glycosyltransferase family 9 protein [Acidimicrobiales bacterium]
MRAGETGVAGLAALVATAGRVACGDTGVGHLATALGRPSVVLFGPVPPSEWGPPPERTHHVALWAGRRGDPRGERVDPGLLDIGVAQVVATLRGLPDRPPAPLAVG